MIFDTANPLKKALKKGVTYPIGSMSEVGFGVKRAIAVPERSRERETFGASSENSGAISTDICGD